MHHPTDLSNTHKRKNCFQNFSLGAITTKLRKGKALRKHSLQTDMSGVFNEHDKAAFSSNNFLTNNFLT